jgi:hypothetical protein
VKFPFDFSVKLVFRLILPGIILGAAMVPTVHAAIRGLGFPDKLEYTYALEVIAWGWAIIISDMPIYMLYEGRRYWPSGIRRLFIWFQVQRLRRLTYAVFHEPIGSRAYLEASVEFGNYPIKDSGESYVQHPTRLGNILAAYENYPNVKYGLDSVFYWYRLWVVLDKDLREEIDNAQSVVDSTVYVSLSFYLSGLIMLVYAGISLLQQTSWQVARYVSLIRLPFIPSVEILVLMGLGCVVLGFTVYRLSLSAHAQFGELFKSIFDMHRSKLTFDDIVKTVSEITGNPLTLCKSRREQNKLAFMYLRWHRIFNEKAGKYQTIGEWKSPKTQDGRPTPMDSNPALPS